MTRPAQNDNSPKPPIASPLLISRILCVSASPRSDRRCSETRPRLPLASRGLALAPRGGCRRRSAAQGGSEAGVAAAGTQVFVVLGGLGKAGVGGDGAA